MYIYTYTHTCVFLHIQPSVGCPLEHRQCLHYNLTPSFSHDRQGLDYSNHLSKMAPNRPLDNRGPHKHRSIKCPCFVNMGAILWRWAIWILKINTSLSNSLFMCLDRLQLMLRLITTVLSHCTNWHTVPEPARFQRYVRKQISAYRNHDAYVLVVLLPWSLLGCSIDQRLQTRWVVLAVCVMCTLIACALRVCLWKQICESMPVCLQACACG